MVCRHATGFRILLSSWSNSYVRSAPIPLESLAESTRGRVRVQAIFQLGTAKTSSLASSLTLVTTTVGRLLPCKVNTYRLQIPIRSTVIIFLEKALKRVKFYICKLSFSSLLLDHGILFIIIFSLLKIQRTQGHQGFGIPTPLPTEWKDHGLNLLYSRTSKEFIYIKYSNVSSYGS